MKKEEKQLSRFKFVIMDKPIYEQHMRVKQIQQNTRPILMSDNLKNTEATKYIERINKNNSPFLR